MIILNNVELKLTEQLLLTVIKNEPNVTYKELAERVQPPIYHRNIGTHIGKISELCADLGLPLLSAKVINSTSHKAGDGFYTLFKQLGISTDGLSEFELFKRELSRIRECKEWNKLSNYLKLDIDFSEVNTKNSIPLQKEIRLLPMNLKYEFPNMTYEEIQEKFFLGELIERKGRYNFRISGIKAGENSLILFQIENLIIASARLLRTEKYNEPLEGIYKGAYIFDIKSIKVFEPISAEELSKIDKNINSFSQVKQKIDISKENDIMALIKCKTALFIPEEISKNDIKNYVEGAKKEIIVNAYERNPKARKECTEYYLEKDGHIVCQICGFDFGKVYGSKFDGKIHIHHIKPLNEINDTYVVNPKKDLIPVCPNCHMILHSNEDGVYSVEEVKGFIEKRSNN